MDSLLWKASVGKTRMSTCKNSLHLLWAKYMWLPKDRTMAESMIKQLTDEGTRSRTVVVTNRHGLHARPCLAIVNTVGRHKAKVTVQKGDQAVDATSVLALMSLGVTQGTELVLSGTGPDAEEVLETLDHLFVEEFGVSYPMSRK